MGFYALQFLFDTITFIGGIKSLFWTALVKAQMVMLMTEEDWGKEIQRKRVNKERLGRQRGINRSHTGLDEKKSEEAGTEGRTGRRESWNYCLMSSGKVESVDWGLSWFDLYVFTEVMFCPSLFVWHLKRTFHCDADDSTTFTLMTLPVSTGSIPLSVNTWLTDCTIS